MDDDQGDGGTRLPEAHPTFAAHFTDPLYDDQGSEFSPFGTDEGADTFSDLLERRDEIDESTTVRDALTLVGCDPQALAAEMSGPEAEASEWGILLGAGFGLLRLTGRIDADGRILVLRALELTQAQYGPDIEELDLMVADLSAFAPDRGAA